ncbi:hypothetical protein GDO86_012302 [Hymenochirus boettgeri]|uniref:Uncharacterized protein n=1 Tax=Hymenochirus boettgeri TaxID=247094 RepID=A0A8T2ISE7_9PIPI|nr:hypothetical protein GDO86_012302 [Hymenochirus boettgeri]
MKCEIDGLGNMNSPFYRAESMLRHNNERYLPPGETQGRDPRETKEVHFYSQVTAEFSLSYIPGMTILHTTYPKGCWGFVLTCGNICA